MTFSVGDLTLPCGSEKNFGLGGEGEVGFGAGSLRVIDEEYSVLHYDDEYKLYGHEVT